MKSKFLLDYPEDNNYLDYWELYVVIRSWTPDDARRFETMKDDTIMTTSTNVTFLSYES